MAEVEAAERLAAIIKLIQGYEMTESKDPMLGKKFHRLTVLEFAGKDKGGKKRYRCQCDCLVIIRGTHIRLGKIQSCGCLRREKTARMGKARMKHNHYANNTPSRTCRSWTSMKSRCTNSNDTSYKNYGGRGITVCERWHKFENFLADMGERPEGKSIDRIDNDKGYSPENCRWATPIEQRHNRRNKSGRMDSSKQV